MRTSLFLLLCLFLSCPQMVNAADLDANASSQPQASKGLCALEAHFDDGTTNHDKTIEDYPQIPRLEKSLLRHTLDGSPLSERLAKMESAAFGCVTDSTDYCNRIARLDAYAEELCLSKPNNGDPDYGEPYVVPISTQAINLDKIGKQQASKHQQKIAQHKRSRAVAISQSKSSSSYLR